MNILLHIGSNIRKIRESKGLSQEKLAEISNLHRTYIGSIERGERNPSILSLQKISEAMQCNISEFFKGIK